MLKLIYTALYAIIKVLYHKEPQTLIIKADLKMQIIACPPKYRHQYMYAVCRLAIA